MYHFVFLRLYIHPKGLPHSSYYALNLAAPIELILQCYKFAMLRGTHPPKLLFAKTTTEAVLYPEFEGITDVNRLSLMKIASRFLLKSTDDNAPSNSLKRRSRNLRLGRDLTTEGKGPTNRLLLRSSSKRRLRFDKVKGRIP
ncbi:hypothetical protein L2E82_32650 [Cichorium intybus]|uniref:Uncharacterized protein n=1 Tax=Cichorium intybus TaxID=13427 RepID=A0ACB9BHS6_CICIN|nr:hypothetical protein L2E82_32650 [Cichorium intybus]